MQKSIVIDCLNLSKLDSETDEQCVIRSFNQLQQKYLKQIEQSKGEKFNELQQTQNQHQNVSQQQNIEFKDLYDQLGLQQSQLLQHSKNNENLKQNLRHSQLQIQKLNEDKTDLMQQNQMQQKLLNESEKFIFEAEKYQKVIKSLQSQLNLQIQVNLELKNAINSQKQTKNEVEKEIKNQFSALKLENQRKIEEICEKDKEIYKLKQKIAKVETKLQIQKEMDSLKPLQEFANKCFIKGKRIQFVTENLRGKLINSEVSKEIGSLQIEIDSLKNYVDEYLHQKLK